MGFFAYIAQLLNSLIGALGMVKTIKDYLPSVPSAPAQDTPKDDNSGGILNPTPAPAGNKRFLITIPENINPRARFNSTGSAAWKNQPGGKHYGTDFLGAPGTPVFAPYDMTVIKTGFYDDSGRFGYYVMGTFGDGTEFYSGHLKDILVKTGETVKGGTQIGSINHLNHTHIQIRINGQLADYEVYTK